MGIQRKVIRMKRWKNAFGLEKGCVNQSNANIMHKYWDELITVVRKM